MIQNQMRALRSTDGYIPDKGLAAAADIAWKLGMPLLLTGEPGTGKTLFASYVSRKLGGLDLHKFLCHTNSVYSDLFYTYDAIGHFRESQKSDPSISEVEEKYIHFEALGKAVKSNKQSVVLIDEIDKAPRDFPNDLLEAMEELRFKVPELNNKSYSYEGEQKPSIIITSNSEKDLPQAFLRRVIYYNIPFPNQELLINILNARIFKEPDNTPAPSIAEHFLKIRNLEGLNKKPATAEFLAWVTFLKNEGIDFAELNGGSNDVLRSSYCILGKSEKDIEQMLKMS